MKIDFSVHYYLSILLFPPVNNFRRFLIHQTCDNFRNKYDLFTFSVGQGPFRRTVICFKNQLLDPHKYSDNVAAANFEIRHKNTIPAQLKSWRSDNRRIEPVSFSNNNTETTTNKRERKMGVERNINDTNKINKYNSADLYRPPALRNLGNELSKMAVTDTKKLTTNGSSLNAETETTTPLTSSIAANTSITTTTTSTSISCNNSPIHRNENVIADNLTMTPTQQYKFQQQQQEVDVQQDQPQRQQHMRRERRPDRAVYIPRARRSQTTPPTPATIQMQQQPQTTQLPTLPSKTTSNTSKSLNQQLAVASGDTTTASVNQKPSSKADEVNNIGGGFTTSTCSNNSTTLTQPIKKKEKINKETKESREQRREQRLLRKLLSISTQHTQTCKNNEYLNENSININSNNDGSDELTSKAFIANGEQKHSSSLTNNVKRNFSELNNLSKGFNCDMSSRNEFILNQEQHSYTNLTPICELNSLEKIQINENKVVNDSILNQPESQSPCATPAQSVEINCKTTSTINNVTTANIFKNNIHINAMPKPSMKTKSNKLNDAVLNQSKLPNLRIEDVALQQTSTKCDVEEQELQRASKEINRSNRRIIKQTFTSDVLLIPDHVVEENEDKSQEAHINKRSNCMPRPTAQIENNTDEDEEAEDDWENMYNDSGDCLDPKIMQELTASVGKCQIELPKMDYSAYLTKQSILNEEEFPHVLEVSNFPVEFRNQDLLMVFSQYKESGFDIKWVDDTHALAVFSSSRIAAEVLSMGHPFVVLKPLAEATVESRLKAKKCASSLQPYRPRPETCPALARRLVTGALGVRLKTAAAERENEKRVLREAKERKLLAAKQRDEVWES